MSIATHYLNVRQGLQSEISKQDPEYIVGVDKEEFLNYLERKFCLPALEKDEERDVGIEKERASHDYIPIKITYPLKPKEKINEAAVLEPSVSTWGGGITLDYDRQEVAFVARTQISVNNIEGQNQIANAIERIEGRINTMSKEIQKENNQTMEIASTVFDKIRSEREKELSAYESWIKKSPVKLVKRNDRPNVFELTVKEVIKPIVSRGKEEEWYLERKQVDSVVSILRNMGMLFERTPRVFSKLAEEELRDILLAGLNGVFKGAATGETFSKSGKTDIHLHVSAKDVLISECKFWNGETQYQNSVNQLFSYLTWRDSFAILITFVKRKDFSDVLTKAKSATSGHQSFIKDSIKTVDDTYFLTRHKSTDEKRQIEVHHMLFNIFV